MPKTKADSKEITRSIRSVLRLEADALYDVSAAVDASYAEAVRLLRSCKGKVIVTGIGKSGIIGQKIASTLASTGTPSLYMHPAEGMHGDLGLVERRDMVIAIGKSGESSELTAILSPLRKIGVRIIAITARSDSTLGKFADIVLRTPIKKEACPLDLAPTSSTTAALAVGDALAITLMRMRGFKKEHFARLHPGGSLGKRLTLRVRDVMRGGAENPVIGPGATFIEALREITRKRAGAALVIDSRGKLIGLITDYDIRRALEKNSDARKLHARDLMNPSPSNIRNDAMAVDAVEIMDDRARPFNVLPVVDAKGRAVGIIQIHDLRAQGL